MPAPSTPCPASASRLGSLILPSVEYTYGRSRQVAEWHESKMAVRRHPAGRGRTRRMCTAVSSCSLAQLTLVVDNVAGLLKVDRVDDLVVPVVLVSVLVLGLAAVARVVEEERVVGTRALHEPLHRRNHVGARRDLARVPRVVRQHHHVVGLVPVALDQELLHIVHVVDAPAQLARLAAVVDADQECLSLAST